MKPAPYPAPLRILATYSVAPRVDAYERQEIAVTLSGGAAPYRNPFDPDEVSVDALVEGPGGRRFRVPGFWDRPDRFRLRVALPALGVWRVTVVARDRSGEARTSLAPIRITGRRSRGFLQRTPKSDRYFVHSGTGKGTLLVGENVCWAGRRGLADYQDWFAALDKAGGNFARLWMAFRPLETKETGAGRYDLEAAAYFDGVMGLAEMHRIDCMLCLMTYGDLATGGYFNEGNWAKHPYNAANGGPVPAARPDDFFTNATARALFKRRLRYLVARYGAYTSLGFWEYWNEKDAPAAWLSEMNQELRRLDPYDHPITNSYTTVGGDDRNRLATIDLTQSHRYGDEGSMRDIAPALLADARAHDRFRKPYLLGEFGISWRNDDSKFDPNGRGINLHNGLWAGALSGAAGTGMIWYWDSYVHPKNLYGQFKTLADFARDVPWTERDFEPIALPPPRRFGREPETFEDLTLTPTAPWGARSAGVTVVEPGGGFHGAAPLTTLMGPAKPAQRSPMQLEVNLPRPSSLTLRIDTVSDRATIVVSVDGIEAARFPLRAAPGNGQDYESTKQFPEYGGIYQAKFNRDRKVAIPAGRHRIRVENVEGDWVSLSAVTFTGARSSRFAALRTAALQDARTSDTLVWLQDPESNWANERERKPAMTWRNVRVRVPAPPGIYEFEWWDTWRGMPYPRGRARPVAGELVLIPPDFARDIALKIRRSKLGTS